MEIFEDEFDFQVFLKIMQQQSVNNDCRIHAYCLMTNHFHLLVETGEVEIDETGYVFPKKRVIISLAPGDIKKSGSHFDLAMAIGISRKETE